MKSQISFTTDIFGTKQSRPDTADDHLFGEDLALWLAKEASGGEFVFGKPFPADWGWAVEATSGEEKFLVGCGIMNESIGDDQADWLITVEKIRKWKMFGSKDSPLRSELCDLIQNVLRDKPHIREIRWTDQVGHFARKKLA
jgi:hypothetical protein